MHTTYRNVNMAFRRLVADLATDEIIAHRTTSRAGDVLHIKQPMLITYERPLERVLFNQERDCNPFFHLFESLWMLAGRNDVKTLAYYSSQISSIASDDGKTFNGAYGHRWRRALGGMEFRQYDGNGYLSPHHIRPIVDQLPLIIDQLKKKPDSRRCVLQMWNVEDDLLKIDVTKDVCCNTNAYFALDGGKLNMTVCNRSNDMIWGMLGANVVHFSFLQEYMAACIGVEVGVYHQFTNNLHVYTERWQPERWLKDSTPDYYDGARLLYAPLVNNVDRFNRELPDFIDVALANENLPTDRTAWNRWGEPFLSRVAYPLALAWNAHRARAYKEACSLASEVLADDWRVVAVNWLRKRQANWERKQEPENAVPAES